MNWNDLHYFVQLVREQTLSATADKLNVGHTTVARRIEHLEKSLDLTLFERVGKRYHLTEAGRGLYEQAIEIEAGVDELHRMATGHDALTGRVTLSVPAGLAYHYLMPKLARFYAKFPNILLEIRGENHRSNLNKKEADIALRVGRPEQDNLVIRKVGNIVYGCYTHTSYLPRLANIGNMDKAHELHSIDLIEFTGHHGLLGWVNELKKSPHIHPIFSSNDLLMVKQCVVQGMGVGILPDLLVNMNDGLLKLDEQISPVSLSLSTEQMQDEFYLVIHSDVRESAKIRAVMDWVYGVFEN